MPDNIESIDHNPVATKGSLLSPVFASARTGEEIRIVGIGASAGGLEACQKFLAAMPPSSGMAFILIQHLDPVHESLMVELLAKATEMPVSQATDGMIVEVNNLYIIPPATYLSFSGGALHLSQPTAERGARLPFDFLLKSLAASVGSQAIGVILSGNGADGTIGLKAIKAAGGLVIAQTPDEADYDGMPRSAIASGNVDFVLPVGDIGAKLMSFRKLADVHRPQTGANRIIALLCAKTTYDFRSYKPGTLERRIAHRMALLGIAVNDTDTYLSALENDEHERKRLVDDLLINVTSFFRDPTVFEALASKVIPGIIDASVGNAIRVWIAGCSTGEETYSIAMLFQEQMEAAKSKAKLQIFASDLDAKAIAFARNGRYPARIKDIVSSARLEKFFVKQDEAYCVSPDLRANIIFTVQDVLVDPPFSNLDFVSCRNLLIYLQPEAQAKVISTFNFALRKGGILLLGSAETVSASDPRFVALSKNHRIFQRTNSSAAGLAFSIPMGELARAPQKTGLPRPSPGVPDLAEFTKNHVLKIHSPASILINSAFQCLYSFGATERYLRVVQGYPTQDFLTMLRPALRARIKMAVTQAANDSARIVVPGGRIVYDGRAARFAIDVCPVMRQKEKLFLICFVDQMKQDSKAEEIDVPPARGGTANKDLELQESRAEIEALSRSLELSKQEQSAINEEASSVNEEFQSANEELVTSKEELQALNEELTALNSQLQETLKISRTTSNDLQNVLYSTDVATLFLDMNLNIRFFTPAVRLLFTVIPSDIGRPLSDLHALSVDGDLPSDALQVLKDHKSIERDIEGVNGAWFNRCVLPYRTQENEVAGVVITFTDVTQRKKTKLGLKAAQLVAERANMAKSRFMAAASHDLRQPLQTLTLLNALLAKITGGEQAQKFLSKMEETTNSMSGILNTLLDINQIDAGVVKPEMESFPINGLLQKLNDEFSYVAEARGLTLRNVPCSLVVYTDPRILEQIIRNLLSNALKYTKRGGVLLGCRRGEHTLRVEIWDSGLGIPKAELEAIFSEYHQVDNTGRDRARGLGLGLSIVQRLGELLGHQVAVRSTYGKGSVFSIEIAISAVPEFRSLRIQHDSEAKLLPTESPRLGSILIIEDDADIRHLLEMFLIEEGHAIAAASDGESAVKLVSANLVKPDLIIVDYNLPNNQNGLQVIEQLRRLRDQAFSVIVCTGDISAETLKNVAKHSCVQMSKPMKLKELNETIQQLLISKPAAAISTPLSRVVPVPSGLKTIYVIDDDAAVRNAMRTIFETNGFHVETFGDCEKFSNVPRREADSCLLVDANLPGMSGLEMLQKLSAANSQLPAIMMTGQGDVKMAVQAIKAGAFDFIEKPVGRSDLLKFVNRVFEQSKDVDMLAAHREKAASQIASLTSRQRQVMELVLAGQPSKNIAADLGISQRTVENHRASIMTRTETKSIPALARLAILATGSTSAS